MKLRRGNPSGFIAPRRDFLIATTLGVSAFAMHLRAETSRKLRRVGIVYPEPTVGPEYRRGWAAFDEEMRQRGWEEGRNIVFERR